MSHYPEHDKLQQVRPKSQTIGEFFEWLAEKRLVLCEHTEYQEFGLEFAEYVPTYKTVLSLLHEYFEIDAKVIEQEKQAMLDECRKVHQSKE